jgi:hypothetical protein
MQPDTVCGVRQGRMSADFWSPISFDPQRNS